MVLRLSDKGRSPKSDIAQSVAVALLGGAALPDGILAQNVTWQKGDTVLIGDTAVRKALSARGLRRIAVEQVVTHGKAAAVSGQIEMDQGPRLFCHMMTFTSAAARQVASVVSFEHPVKERAHAR